MSHLHLTLTCADVGMCIGRAGCVIREMQNQSGTKIQIPSFSTPGMLTRIATVTGPPEGCERVKQMIERIVLEQSSQSVMSGTGPQGHDQYGQSYGGAGHQYGQGMGGYDGGGGGGYGAVQQQGYGDQQAQAGVQDYSKEWAAYYAAQAAAQGGQVAVDPGVVAHAAPVAAQVPAPAPAQAQTTLDTYHEEFFRYSYYYGEEAARAYYGAWSPPHGTPNPYGVNPNGITPAPAPAPASAQVDSGQQAVAPVAASQAAAPAAMPANVRDSGRRGVSNLPAWMTKG